ncbi:hypothetical protein EROM_070940 [Encephalitozoon romaleae SJ-2008]|uniref:Uncharacterized protein n=1 Tax=Encephalitozoon romaleae (strain SJ-2008) TaxID=1178016 RepID=I7AF80_ENCRO|nr:hypothetical protein EROM_070940 [Encephalitozoon romaleae SJ-2008]AFN83345.1 hypothetical protein EROM_070940 [Encephalitozoon romaleae SJ-2008]
MRVRSGIYLFLRIAASKDFLATIRPINSDKVFRTVGESIELSPNRGEDLAIFHVVTKKEKRFKLFGMRLGKHRHMLLISPGSNPELYLGYSKEKGLGMQKKRKYWEYREVGNGGYILKAKKNKCLGVAGNNTLGVFKCRNEEGQVFIFEKKNSHETSGSTSEDSHIAITSEPPQVPGTPYVQDKSWEDFQTSQESSDSSSDSSIVRPVFINLNMKDKKAYADDQEVASLSVMTSTTTVSVTITRSSSIREVSTTHPMSVVRNSIVITTRIPSSVASIWNKMAATEELQTSYDSSSSSEVHRMPFNKASNGHYEKIKDGMNLDLDFEFYPELGRLLKSDGYRRSNPHLKKREARKKNKAKYRDKMKENRILSSGLECFDSCVLNPLQQTGVKAPPSANIR